MLLSQNLITKNNVNSYNTSVTQINQMQKNEAAVVSNMLKQSEDKLAALENKVELIKNTIAAANRQLYICEKLLDVWS
jgi:septal ring factor EnvC (AmiA/AmiB activator)